ncbi:MAG: ankyrin repeat domain-containing protein [Aureispira sp.]
MDLTEKIVLAAEQGKVEQVKEALQEGASPDAMGPNSGALHCAAAGGHIAVVETLLAAGANPNIADQQSFYPLHLAASKCADKICVLLLKFNADITVQTHQGGTALHVAAATGCPDVVAVLLQNGANLEAKDSYGATPLLVAAAEGENQIIQALLKAGASVAVVDKNKENALLKASRRLLQTRIKHWQSVGKQEEKAFQYEIVQGCFRYNADYDTKQVQQLGRIISLQEQQHCVAQSWGPKQHIHYLNAWASIQTLLQTSIAVDAPNIVGHSPMWMICAAGESKLMQALYAAGANFDAVEDNGEFKGATCLHKVAASGRLDGVEMFFQLNKNYIINTTDHYGWTPLHYFADMGGSTSIGTLLLEKGANKAAASSQDRGKGTPRGILPYQVALHWKDQVVADLLKET